MKSYKNPSFQDRAGQAAEAKEKALNQLRAKPPVDEAVLAKRRAAALAKQAAQAQKRADKKAREESEKAAKAESAAAAAVSLPSQAELKSARDARYAARKARK